MAAHLTEEEQIEALKRWWKDNGKSTVAAIAVLLAGFFGWNQYKDYQQTKAEDGSVIFEKFISLTTESEAEVDEAKEAEILKVAEQISEHDSSSLYSDFAQLYLAKLSVDKGDLSAAETILSKIASTSADSSIQDLARLRYSRILAANGQVDKALGTLSSNVSSAFASAFAEAKGDILVSQSRIQDAHAAYNTALQSLDASLPMRRNLIQLKLDNTQIASGNTGSSSSESNPHTAVEAGDA